MRRFRQTPLARRRYRSEILRELPSLYWRLDEITGTSAADSSGNNRSGTYSGTFTLGATSLLTSDGDLSASVSSGGVLSTYNPFSGDLTMEAWCYRTSSASFSNLFGSTSTTHAVDLRFGRTSGPPNATDVTFTPDTGSVSAVTWSAVLPGLNVAFHVALTWVNATKAAELFINGVSQGALTLTAGFNATPGNFKVGGFGSTFDFPGQLDEVAVYPFVLSARRIADHFHAAGR